MWLSDCGLAGELGHTLDLSTETKSVNSVYDPSLSIVSGEDGEEFK